MLDDDPMTTPRRQPAQPATIARSHALKIAYAIAACVGGALVVRSTPPLAEVARLRGWIGDLPVRTMNIRREIAYARSTTHDSDLWTYGIVDPARPTREYRIHVRTTAVGDRLDVRCVEATGWCYEAPAPFGSSSHPELTSLRLVELLEPIVTACFLPILAWGIAWTVVRIRGRGDVRRSGDDGGLA